ncbi:hypothetical protein WAI453_006448 [Rhynchosporium graminicola]
MQPLDVSVFLPYKHCHSKAAVQKAVKYGDISYGIEDFLYDLPEIREKTFTVATIKSGFRNSGVWPLDEIRLKNKMKIYSVPNIPDSFWIIQEFPCYLPEFNTPPQEQEITLQIVRPLPPTVSESSGYKEAVDMLKYWRARLALVVSSPSKEIFNTSFDAIQTVVHTGANVAHELTDMRRGIKERNERKLEFQSAGNKRIGIGHGGPIDASQGHTMKKRKREEEELARQKTWNWWNKVKSNKVSKLDDTIAVHQRKLLNRRYEKDWPTIPEKITSLDIDRSQAILDLLEWRAANGSTVTEKSPLLEAPSDDPHALILDFNSEDDCEGDDDVEIPQFDQIQKDLATQEKEETGGGSSAFDASQSDFLPFTEEMLPPNGFHATTYDPHYFR